MDNRVIQVPVSLLLDPGQTPATKVVWMALRLHPAAGPAELEAHTGLSRHTVLRAAARHRAANRPPGRPQETAANRTPGRPQETAAKRTPGRPQETAASTPGQRRLKVPAALLADRTVGPQAKVLYGLLQTTADFRGQAGQFTYASLCALTHLSRNTVKRAIAELVGARWIQAGQPNPLSPIRFTLGSPEQLRSQSEAALAARRLKRAKFVGEALMQEYLSLLIDSDEFTENARPGFLVNPLSGERLELDRFYPPAVAFEFHGAQHDRSTARFSQSKVDQQHLRDLIKAGICLYRGIELVIIRAEDLSLEGMQQKIGRRMPLRSLAGQAPLIDLLTDASLTYRASAEAARAADKA